MKAFTYDIKVWSFGVVFDFDQPYVGIGLGPAIVRLGKLARSFDFRITYICAHCGRFAEVSFWAVEVFDSGTTLKCDKCKRNTVFDLDTAEDRAKRYRALDALDEILGSLTPKERIKLLTLWQQSLRSYIPNIEPECGHLVSLYGFIDMAIEALCKFKGGRES